MFNECSQPHQLTIYDTSAIDIVVHAAVSHLIQSKRHSKPLTKSDVRSQLAKYIALFEDPNSVMVCEEVRSIMCGTAKLEGWLKSTGMQSGTGRKYNRKLFSVPDRMLWVTGVTLFERAKELDDWGMKAIEETFPDFKVNKVDSGLNKRYIGPDQPNGCYWQAVRAYLGTVYAFARERKQLDSAKGSARHYADLARRFRHPHV